MGAACRLPLFKEDVVAANLLEASAESRPKALDHCVRVGEAVCGVSEAEMQVV